MVDSWQNLGSLHHLHILHTHSAAISDCFSGLRTVSLWFQSHTPPPGHQPIPQAASRSGCSKMQIWSYHSLVSNPSAAPHPLWKESQIFIRDWMRDLLRFTLLSSILSHQSHNQPNPQWAGGTIRTIRTSIAGMLQERTLHLNTKIFKGGWGFKEFFKCINTVNKTGK